MCLLCLVKCCSCYWKSLLRMDLDPVIFLQGQRFATQSIIWMIYCEMLACTLDIMKENTPGKHKICAACRRFCLTAGRFPTYTWKFFGSGAQVVKSNKKDQRIGGQGLKVMPTVASFLCRETVSFRQRKQTHTVGSAYRLLPLTAHQFV